MYLRKSKKNIVLIIVGIILVTCVILLFYFNKSKKIENFESNPIQFEIDDVDYYVITMGQPKRLQNIQDQIDKMNKEYDGDTPIDIIHIDAVNGDHLDLDELVSAGKMPKEVLTEPIYNGFMPGEKMHRRKYEVGVYMSHVKSLEQVKQSKKPYSIIFEDDFEIQDGFFDKLQDSMDYILKNKPDFDLVLLGLNGPGVKSEHIDKNIYKFSCEKEDLHNKCYGIHAYLIPNKTANKLLPMLNQIDEIIDAKIFRLAVDGKINIYQIAPDLVKQNSPSTGSIIR